MKFRYPPTRLDFEKMRKYLRKRLRLRFYGSIPRDVYRGYIWSYYWYLYKRESHFWDTPKEPCEQGMREVPKLERVYYLLAEAKHLDIDLHKISVDDFTVHLHLWGDSFSKGTQTIKEDLKGVAPDLYRGILDSLYYKDVYIAYLPRVRHRLLAYLKKGAVYTTGRVTRTLLKKVDGGSPKYFTLRENQIISNRDKMVGIVCDRVKFYKEFYE